MRPEAHTKDEEVKHIETISQEGVIQPALQLKIE